MIRHSRNLALLTVTFAVASWLCQSASAGIILLGVGEIELPSVSISTLSMDTQGEQQGPAERELGKGTPFGMAGEVLTPSTGSTAPLAGIYSWNALFLLLLLGKFCGECRIHVVNPSPQGLLRPPRADK